MNLRRSLTALPPLLLGAAVLAQPAAAAAGFGDGVELCLCSLLPALFPFFVVCTLVETALSQHQPLALLVLSWLGGYAVCARLARGTSPARKRWLLVIGCCSGPGFVIGCLGGQLLGSVRLGVLLYGLQLGCNLLAAALLLPFIPPASLAAPAPTAMPAQPDERYNLSDAIQRAVDSALAVSGCVVFFRVVYAVTAAALPSALRPFASALLEISAGCADFAAAGGPMALYGICLCLSLWGVSVFVQLRALAGPGIPWKLLLASRALHAVLLQGAIRLCVRALPGEAAVFTSLAPRVIPMQRLRPDAAVVIFLFFCAVLYKIRQRFYNGGSELRGWLRR